MRNSSCAFVCVTSWHRPELLSTVVFYQRHLLAFKRRFALLQLQWAYWQQCEHAAYALLPYLTAPSMEGAVEKEKWPRAVWTEDEMKALVRAWADKIDDLRSQKWNASVYDAIVSELVTVGVVKTRKQVHTKIENMTLKYRKHCRAGTTGSAGVSWPYFWDINKFLGSLPVNDPALAQESTCWGVSQQQSVDEIIHGMQHGCDETEENAGSVTASDEAASEAAAAATCPSPNTAEDSEGT